MNVPAKTMLMAQQLKRIDDELGCVVGRLDDTRADEQPFDVVATIELDGQIGKLLGRESCALDLVAASVNAVGTIIDADVGHEHLEQ